MRKIPHLRWIVIGMLFIASVLNYIDRQALSLLAPTIQRELHIDDNRYAWILNAFLVAYTIAYALSGRLTDKLGARVGLSIFIGWWSLSNMLTALARSAGALACFRFSLGLGEAGNWTAAPKVVSDWFPARERGIAVGIYTLGASLGATIAPILIIALASWHSWRAAFVVTGAAGLLWIIPWVWLYRPAGTHPRLTDREREIILRGADEKVLDSAPPLPWSGPQGLLKRRELWLFLFARLLTDPIWYFYQFWFVKYLYDARGVDQRALSLTWIIFLAADLGAIGGGWFSGRLINRKTTPAMGRMWAMLGSACLLPVSALVPHVASLSWVLAFGMVVAFAQLAWQTNLTALVVDIIPARSLSSIIGIIGAGSAVGGIIMNQGVAYTIGHYSYARCFYTMALIHPLTWGALWLAGRRQFAAGRPLDATPALSPA